MPESWVINASPVILLAKAGLIQRVLIGSAVVNQIAKHGKSKTLVTQVGKFVKSLADAVKTI